MIRVCAVVVTYFPAQTVVENVKILAEQVDEVILVDNGTAGPSAEYIKQLQDVKKVTLISNGQNLGIAIALNVGARYAIEHGYPWLATFDQDSKIPPDYFKTILTDYDAIGGGSKFAILSPIFFDRLTNQTWQESKIKIIAGVYREIDATITSGSLINTETFAEIGFFDEELFIDYVDFDYCLRCRREGYKIIQFNRVILNHNLGRKTIHSVFGKTITTTNHSPTRRYYISRNRLIIYARFLTSFPHWVLSDFVEFIKESIKILAFEDQKFSKFRMIFLGVWHAFSNKREILQDQAN